MPDFKVSLAPQQLWQAINPWTFNQQGAQFGLINISLGQTPRPDVEAQVLEDVGSYGRQIGRIGDALGVLVGKFDRSGLSREDNDKLDSLIGQLADVRRIKARKGADAGAEAAQ